MDAGSLKIRQTQLGLGWQMKVPQQSSESTLKVIPSAYKFWIGGSSQLWLHADNTQMTILCLVLSSLLRFLSYLNIPPAQWLNFWKNLGCELFIFNFLIQAV